MKELVEVIAKAIRGVVKAASADLPKKVLVDIVQ